MIFKTVFLFALVASTFSLPLENAPVENQEKSDEVKVVPVDQAPAEPQPSDEIRKNDDVLPPVEEPNPLAIDGPAPLNPVENVAPEEKPENQSPAEEKSDLDTANTFGFGYGGWGYRPYWGYGGGWRRGFGFGGYGYGGYGLGFYGRAYSPWGWRGYYYY